MTNQPTNTTRKPLLFALCLVSAAMLSACDKPQADKAAKPAVQATATAAAVSSASAADGMPNITTEDMGNLARAMHGAASQQPDDAPKDKYGQPYIIGNLGGVPVNLPSSVVQFVEYDDSPGWDPEELRTYNPPTRSYQSILESFGLSFRNHDRLLYDNKNETVRKQYNLDRQKDDDDWIRISVNAGKRHGGNKYWLNDLLQDYLRPEFNLPSPYKREEGKNYFGLEVYVNYGIEPQTGRPWREHWQAEDIFIARDQEGNVQTHIRCFNGKVPSPPCSHEFNFPPPMKIRAYLSYNRHTLLKWREIQDNAIYIIQSFQASHK